MTAGRFSPVRSGKVVRVGILVGAAMLLAGTQGCSASSEQGAELVASEVAVADESSIEAEYPDAQRRALDVMARAPRPVENSAVPPRHLDRERFPDALVDPNMIVSGGPGLDGIPSIDGPSFEPVSTDSTDSTDSPEGTDDPHDWLEDNEPVAVLSLGAETHIYPLQILIWHEIVNDEIDGRPVALTYCPLCNSVVAVERVVDGRTLDFGTSGALYKSALVMYDRQTESLWTHFDGRAVVGTLTGAELTVLPAATMSWADAKAAYPGALVLTRDTGVNAPYGESPYANYESIERAPAGFITGVVDPRLPPKSRVVGIGSGQDALAVSLTGLSDAGVLAARVGGAEVVLFWRAGQSSALDGERVADGRDVGSTAAFVPLIDGQQLDFELRGENFVDTLTESVWSLSGRATGGPLVGRELEPVVHLDTFWFAWSAYHPATEVVD